MSTDIDFEYISPKIPTNPTLIFVHGAGGDKSQWDFQKKYFIEKQFGIIVLSLPGHGSSSDSELISIEAYTKSLHALLVTLNFKKGILIGHSMGGAIALQMILHYTDLAIENLVLIGSGAKLGVAPIFFDTLEKDFKNALKLMEIYAYHEKTDRELKLQNGKVALKNGANIFIKDFQACDDFDVRSRLNEITIPTLIICGKDDKLTPVKHSNFLHENISNSNISIIPESSHFVFQEKSVEVNQLIEQWISS
jgi:pimeloyl-ACP methyl ester carboxylesterase